MNDLNTWQNILFKIMVTISDILGSCSDKFHIRFANFIAFLMWHLIPSRRKYTINAIEKHLQLSPIEAKKIAKKSYQENCLSFVEICKVGKYSFKSPEIKIANLELLELLKSNTRPIVACTAHFGSWEIMAALIAELNLERQCQIVIRRHHNPVIRAYLERQRGLGGAQVVEHRNAIFTVLKALKKNGITAFLVDHNCSKDEAIFLPFLGEEAAVNQGPALLALRSEALVFPAFLSRQDNGNYLFELAQPLDPKRLEGSREEKQKAIASFYSQEVENIIKKNPAQWFWMHKRWKTKRDA